MYNGVVVVSANVPPVKSLFRANAIKNFNSLEEVSSSIKIIKPSAWLWMAIFLLMLTSAGIWVFCGRIEFTTDSEGIILPEHELKRSEFLFITHVKEHQEKIAVLKQLVINKEKMLKKGYITLVDYEQTKSDYEAAEKDLTHVSSESYLSSLHPLYSTTSSLFHSEELTALVFIDPSQGKNVMAGMEAYILPSGLSAYEYGYIKGKVISVSEYPVSKEIVFSYFGNANLVDEFFKNGAPYMAKIMLLKNSQIPSGFAWTTKHGPNFNMYAGSMATVKIIYQQCSPWRLISIKGSA
jgi:hypothetical protein